MNMLRLPSSKIEMVRGEPVATQPQNQSAYLSDAYVQLQNAWRSPAAVRPSNSGYPGRLSIHRGPRRSWEDTVVTSTSEDMHRSYSTESLTSSEDDELAYAGDSGARLSSDSKRSSDTGADVIPENSKRGSGEIGAVESIPRASRNGKTPKSNHSPSSCAAKTKQRRRDSVLSRNGSDGDPSMTIEMKPAPSPLLNLDLSLDGHETPAAHRFTSQSLPADTETNGNDSAKQCKAETHNKSSQIRRRHSRSHSEPPITTLTRHRPKATPRHRRYVSLEKHGQPGKSSIDAPRPIQMPRRSSKSLLTYESGDNLSTSPTSFITPPHNNHFDDRDNPTATEGGAVFLTESPRTSLESFDPNQQAQPTLQRPLGIRVEASESDSSASALDEPSTRRQRSPISSASSEALRNRRSPLDELARRVASHIGDPWIAKLPVRQREHDTTTSPALRFPRFEEPFASPISPISSLAPGASLWTPAAVRQSQPPPRSARMPPPRPTSSSPPIYHAMPEGGSFEAGHGRYLQHQSLPQQYSQPARSRASTWTPAHISDSSSPAQGWDIDPPTLTRHHTRSMHQIPRRPVPASQPTRRHLPSAEQENEDHMREYERERARYFARQQQSSRGGVMNETPPREGRLERRLR